MGRGLNGTLDLRAGPVISKTYGRALFLEKSEMVPTSDNKLRSFIRCGGLGTSCKQTMPAI